MGGAKAEEEAETARRWAGALPAARSTAAPYIRLLAAITCGRRGALRGAREGGMWSGEGMADARGGGGWEEVEREVRVGWEAEREVGAAAPAPPARRAAARRRAGAARRTRAPPAV